MTESNPFRLHHLLNPLIRWVVFGVYRVRLGGISKLKKFSKEILFTAILRYRIYLALFRPYSRGSILLYCTVPSCVNFFLVCIVNFIDLG